jgi:MFS family permease
MARPVARVRGDRPLADPVGLPAGGKVAAASGRGFWLAGALLALGLASSTAPSILYRRYQAEWHFSSGLLTAVFAVYSLAVILALLLTGSASDGGRRKPYVVMSLGLFAVSMVIFAAAEGVAWLFVARIVQGLGMGVGLSALGGMLLDLRPGSRQGAFVNQAAPNVGMIIGALGAGLLVDYGPRPSVVVYLVLLAVFLASVPLVLRIPEPARPSRRRLVVLSRICLPAGRQGEFWLMSLGAIATWAVGGFYLSLGPTVSAQVLDSDRYTVNGVAIAILGGAALLSQILCYGWSFRREMVVGAVLLGLGTAGVLVSLWEASALLFFTGSVVLSLGWGLTAIGSFRSVVALAEPARAAEVVAAIYAVSYLAFSIPSVLAGYAAEPFGLRSTMLVFGVAVSAMAAVAAVTAVRVSPAAEARP